MENNIFFDIRNLIYKHSGIYFNENRFYLLESRLQKRLEVLQIDSFEKYYDFLLHEENLVEWKELFDVITINETYFFRSPEQLEVLYKYIIPEIISSKKSTDKNIRIWSAGCSTGAEPYSIAIVIDEYLKHNYNDINFQIFASDINGSAIRKAKQGIYNEYAIKNIPTKLLMKYFTISDAGYKINDIIKQLVRFANINLFSASEVRHLLGVDIIFCENVLIYFDIPSKQKVVSYFHNVLNNNGYLILGYSESLHGISKEFSLVHFPKVIVYKKM